MSMRDDPRDAVSDLRGRVDAILSHWPTILTRETAVDAILTLVEQDRAALVEALNEAHQFIYPIVNGKKIDFMWLDAAKAWCVSVAALAGAKGEK